MRKRIDKEMRKRISWRRFIFVSTVAGVTDLVAWASGTRGAILWWGPILIVFGATLSSSFRKDSARSGGG